MCSSSLLCADAVDSSTALILSPWVLDVVCRARISEQTPPISLCIVSSFVFTAPRHSASPIIFLSRPEKKPASPTKHPMMTPPIPIKVFASTFTFPHAAQAARFFPAAYRLRITARFAAWYAASFLRLMYSAASSGSLIYSRDLREFSNVVIYVSANRSISSSVSSYAALS